MIESIDSARIIGYFKAKNIFITRLHRLSWKEYVPLLACKKIANYSYQDHEDVLHRLFLERVFWRPMQDLLHNNCRQFIINSSIRSKNTCQSLTMIER